MVFIFYVNRGLFYKFDSRLEQESILSLKRIIEKNQEIPVSAQVILVSGGDEPPDNTLVGDCQAGTEDNNPIYLFRKVESDQVTLETTAESLRDVRPLQERVTSLINLQPSYNTVQQRVRLSKDFNEHAKAQMSTIRRLVKEQHMMSQGWYVALANLDEKCERIRKRYGDFCQVWENYAGERDVCEKLVVNFEEHVDLLRRIRLPDALVAACCAPQLMAESSVTASQVSLLQEMHQKERSRSPSDPSGLSLFDWMSSFDKRGSLLQVLAKFRLTLTSVNNEVANKIALELPDALAWANENAQEHRVVQGLEQRLTQMSHYQNKAEARIRTQHEMMTTLASNLERLERERDASVVGELCKQHKRVLMAMAENHKKQTEAVQFALNGKNDFMRNLHMRFAWLTRIEMMLMHQETYFMTIYKRLREMNIYREILLQAKNAAPLYAQTLVEMVRRREFSQRYMTWSANVVERSLSLYEEEVAKRKTAAQRLDKHFLLCLFRSLKQFPSKFAAKPPINSDAALPELTRNDIDELRARVPELAPLLVIEGLSPDAQTSSGDDAGIQASPDPPRFHLGPVSDEEFSDAVTAVVELPQEAPEKGANEAPETVAKKEEEEEEEEDDDDGREASEDPRRQLLPSSEPIRVPSRTGSEALMDQSSTGSPFVEMQRPHGEDDEIFSSALLNLEESQREQAAGGGGERSCRCENAATQTDPPPAEIPWRTALSRLAAEEVPALRRTLAAVSQTVANEAELARSEAEAVHSAVERLTAAYAQQLATETARLVSQHNRERENITARLDEAYVRIESLNRELLAERDETARLNEDRAAAVAAAERSGEERADQLQRKLLLEHEVALEGERGKHASELQAVQAELREAKRLTQWAEEKARSASKERELLDRAALAEKKVYDAEVERLRDEIDSLKAAGAARIRSRRVSVSSDTQVHILEEFPRRGFEAADVEVLAEDEDLDSGWVKKGKEEVIHEQDVERIAQLEELLGQRDNTIHDLRVSVDRLSQQVMRDRDHIRQLRGDEATSRSPQALSRSPPVLEQPAPISSSFRMMSSSPSRASAPPVTSPPKSVMPSSSMTESAISSVSSTGGGPAAPSSPAPGGPGRELESPPVPAAMMTSATSAAISNASARGIKLVLSLFRSGDRVLLLRNPSTGLWFMLSTDGWSYFVHNDCFASLELSTSKFYMFAEFKSKERCLARKNKNRFSLPAGDYFFRIKARLLRSAPGQCLPGQVAIAAQVSCEGAQSKPSASGEGGALSSSQYES